MAFFSESFACGTIHWAVSFNHKTTHYIENVLSTAQRVAWLFSCHVLHYTVHYIYFVSGPCCVSILHSAAVHSACQYFLYMIPWVLLPWTLTLLCCVHTTMAFARDCIAAVSSIIACGSNFSSSFHQCIDSHARWVLSCSLRTSLWHVFSHAFWGHYAVCAAHRC